MPIVPFALACLDFLAGSTFYGRELLQPRGNLACETVFQSSCVILIAVKNTFITLFVVITKISWFIGVLGRVYSSSACCCRSQTSVVSSRCLETIYSWSWSWSCKTGLGYIAALGELTPRIPWTVYRYF